MAIKKDNSDKSEKSAKKFIDLCFEPHKGIWLQNAKRLNEWFNGRYNTVSGGTKNVDKFTVNSIFSLVNTLIPNFIFQNPHIKVRALNPSYQKKLVTDQYQQIDNVKAAFIREAAINHTYKKISGIDEDRKATQDSFFYGFGICKTGYSYETTSADDKDYDLKNQYYHKRVNPKDFGWHPMATGVDDSPKLTHRLMISKDAFSVRYPKIDIEDVSSEIPQHLKEKFKGTQKDIYKDYVTLYEVHDQEQDMIYVFAGDSKMLVEKKKNPYDFKGSHFSMIKFSGENDEFQGIPFMLMVEDEAKALNEIMTLIVQHFRKFTGQVFYNNGAIDEDDKERIINAEQGSLHAVNDISQILRQPPLQMGPEYFNAIGVYQSLMEKTLGIPEFRPNSRKSATEASFIQGDANARRSYYLEIVKKFVIDGISKIGDLQAQFQDEKEEFMTSAIMGNQHVKYDKSDIQGEWQFNFDVDNLAFVNESEFNQINNMLNVLGAHQVLNPILATLDPNKTARELFKRVNLNIESFQSGAIEEAIVFTPDKENEIASKGDLMPRPKKGEDHEGHIASHKRYVENIIKSVGPEQAQKMPQVQQIIEHIAETTMIMNEAVIKGSPPAAEVQSPQSGPQGPMQSPPVPPTMQ